MSSRFRTDTAVEALGAGRYAARVDPGWWIERGPNGGYIAALVLRAMSTELDDPGRPARSLTLHYLRPPREGDAELVVTIERAGRTLTNLSARFEQDGRLLALALAAFADARPGPEFLDSPMPAVPPAEEVVPLPEPPVTIPMRARYESRFAVGPLPFSGSADAESGGWIRLAPDEVDQDEVVDQHLLAAFTDAWIPAVFSKVVGRLGVPTVDLTIHFRAPGLVVPADEWVLTRFRTRAAAEGFLEEDGEIWSPDGRLLAQSRQLAVVLGG